MLGKILYNCIKYIHPLEPCTFCLDTQGPVCDACYSALPWIQAQCIRCGRGGAVNGICVPCQVKPSVFDYCFAPFDYQPPLSTLITQLKFQGQLHRARTLAHCFTQAATDYAITLPDLLIPMPAHPKRTRHRGFNQSNELCRLIAKNLQLPWDARLVRKRYHTPPQNQLKQEQRLKNLSGAFAMRKPCATAHVAIIDDVITTGTTASELSRVLKQAGVAKVDIWAVCESVSKNL